MRNAVEILDTMFYSGRCVACCCGHSRYPMSFIIRDGCGDTIEIFSGIRLPRKKRFYVKDKDGYYYIPEVVNLGKTNN